MLFPFVLYGVFTVIATDMYPLQSFVLKIWKGNLCLFPQTHSYLSGDTTREAMMIYCQPLKSIPLVQHTTLCTHTRRVSETSKTIQPTKKTKAYWNLLYIYRTAYIPSLNTFEFCSRINLLGTDCKMFHLENAGETRQEVFFVSKSGCRCQHRRVVFSSHFLSSPDIFHFISK